MLLFTSVRTYGAALAAATSCLAGPLLVADPTVITTPANELVARDHPMISARAQYLEKRLSTDFALDMEWSNEVLFGGNVVDDNGAESTDFQVTCVECWTKGVVTANLKNEDVINPVLRLDFTGVEAFVDLGVKAAGGATYAVNLFSSQDPSGLGIPGLSLGLVFYLDLVISLSSDVDLTGGFYVKLADGSFMETEVFTGDITDHLFDNLSAKPLDVVVHAGSATFKASLRVRVQCGAEADVDIAGVGASAVVGIYANIVEFVAAIDSTPECPLQSREWFDLNVGAFARLDVVVDFTSVGAVPTVSTTLINSPTFTQCLDGVSPGETSSVAAADATSAKSSPESTEPSAVAFLPSPDTTVAAEGAPVGEAPKDDASSGPAIKRSLSYDAETAKPTDDSNSTPSDPTYPDADASSSPEKQGVNAPAHSTAEYMVTSCAVPVVNCPASLENVMVITRTYDPNVKPSDAPAIRVVTDAMVLTPCEPPIVQTFDGAMGALPTDDTSYVENEEDDEDEEGDEDEDEGYSKSKTRTRTRAHRHGHRHRPTPTDEDYETASTKRYGYKHKPTSTQKFKHKATVPATAWTKTNPYPVSVVTPQPQPTVPNLPDVNISVWMQTASMTSSLVMGNLGGGAVAPAAPVVPAGAPPSSSDVAAQIPTKPVAVVAGAAKMGGVGVGGAAFAAVVATVCGLMVL